MAYIARGYGDQHDKASIWLITAMAIRASKETTIEVYVSQSAYTAGGTGQASDVDNNELISCWVATVLNCSKTFNTAHTPIVFQILYSR